MFGAVSPPAPTMPRRARPVVLLAGPLASIALGCRGVTDAAPAALPSGAVAFTPPPVYARWWALTSACAGRAADAGPVTWYVVPGAATVPTGGRDVAGFASPQERLVVLAGRYQEAGEVVRHEMLHLLLGAGARDAPAHPPAYFQDRCAGVVECPAVGCADEGAPPPTVPADAPTVALSALDLRVDVTPAPASAAVLALTGGAAADPWLTVVVRVTNPSAGPVWVPLEPSDGQGASATEVGGFGYEIARADGSGAFESVWLAVPRGRVGFAAGQTHQYVFDVNAAGYTAGEYAVRGRYNVRTGASTFRVGP